MDAQIQADWHERRKKGGHMRDSYFKIMIGEVGYL
jgi:hypothetical protein